MLCLAQQVAACHGRLLARPDAEAVLARMLQTGAAEAALLIAAFDLGWTRAEIIAAPRDRFIAGEADLPTWTEQPDGVALFTLPVRDHGGGLVDLLAFDTDGAMALRFGHAALLGAPAVAPWRFDLDQPVPVQRDLAAWFSAWLDRWRGGAAPVPHQHGVCLLGAKPDAERHLGHVPHLACASKADRAWLLALLEANRKARRAREPALPGVWVKHGVETQRVAA